MRALLLLLALGTAGCGVLDDGPRRYSCLRTDDCMDGYDCTGVIKVGTDGGGCPAAAADKINGYHHDGNACFYLYCLPVGRAECDDKRCPAGYQCGVRPGDDFVCVKESGIRNTPAACDQLVDSQCGSDSGNECVLSMKLVVEHYPQSQDDFSIVKRCIQKVAVQGL